MREERIVLEDHANVALVRWRVRRKPAVDPDLARIRLDEARYRHQHGGLARARRAEQRQKLTLLEIEARTGKRDDAAISLSEIYGLELRLMHGARAILRLVR